MDMLDTKQKIILGIVGGVIIIVIGIYFYSQYQSAEEEVFTTEELQVENTIEEVEEGQIEEENEIIIHISGAVVNEGIVKIIQGARIADVIEKAGGLKENASLKNVNLAYMVEDGQKIYIPTVEEEELGQDETKEYLIIEDGNNSSISSLNFDKGDELMVNLNKATQTELEELPGIGTATALKIINYRNENGEFKTIEDIKNVNGIGDAKFNNIKEFICVK